MPYENSRDRREAGSYHLFNRRPDGLPLFVDDEDRMVFEDIIKRYISAVPRFDARGRQYENLRDRVRLNAQCLLTTHHHEILNQLKPGGMEQLMRRTYGAYTKYFRQRHGGSGPLFAGPYRTTEIDNAEQFKWRVAYVHDNHKRLGIGYRFSTHRYFLTPDEPPSWLDVNQALTVFGGKDAYLDYLAKREIRATLDAQLRGPDNKVGMRPTSGPRGRDVGRFAP